MAQDFTLKINHFAGLRYSSDNTSELSDGESPEMVNFKVTSGQKLKRREGYSLIFPSPETVRGLYHGFVGGKMCYLAAAGSTLLFSKSGFHDLAPLEGEVPGEGKVTFFPFYGDVYLLTGTGIVKFDGEKIAPIDPYIPLVMISTAPDGSGVMYEEVNLLTRKVRQSFSPDGESCRFYPILKDLKRIDWVRLEGEEVAADSYIWDANLCAFSFVGAPAAGIDTLEVQYEIEGEDPSSRILNCRFASSFGGASDTRAFLYGNPDSAAVRYHSGIVEGKPTFAYFPETAFSLVGTGEPITSIVRHYDRQLIFTASSAYYSYLEYMTGSEEKIVAAFPVLPLNDERGCVPEGQALLVENTPVTLTENGLFEWVSTNIRDERNAKNISEPIDPSLQKEKAEHALLFNRKENTELYICIGSHGYVYNYRSKLFYYYTLPPIRGFCQGEEELFFYTDEGIFSIGGETDNGEAIRAKWRSKLFDFSAGEKEKKLFGVTLFGRAESGGEIKVSLSDEEEEGKAVRQVQFLAKETGETKRLRLPKRRFQSLRVEIEWESPSPLYLSGIFLKGRITEGQV